MTSKKYNKKNDEIAISDLDLLTLALDAQRDTFFLFDPQTGKAVKWNKAFREISGYTDEEIAQLPAPDSYYRPDDLKKANQFIQSVFTAGSSTIELDLICKDGHAVPTEYRVSMIRDDLGNPKYLISIGRDISDRRKADQVIQESVEKFQSLYDNINVALALHEMVYDKKGIPVDFIFLDCNLAYENLTQLKKDNIVGKMGRDVIPNLEQKWIDTYSKVALTGEAIAIIDHSDYLDKYWEVKAYSPKKGQFAVALTDITERIKTENALKESEAKFRTITEQMSDMVFLTDEKSHIKYVSPAAENIFGYLSKEMCGHSFMDFLASEDVPIAVKAYQTAIQNNEKTRNLELQMKRKDGSTFTGELNGTFYKRDNVVGTMGLIRDITKRKQSEEQLKTSEEKLRNIIENSASLYYTHTADHKITYISPQSAEYLQCSPEEAMIHWTEFATDHPINQKGIAITNQAIKTGQRQPSYELELQGREGNKIWVEVREAPVVKNGKTVSITGALTDVTKRKEAEEQIKSQHERLFNIIEGTNVGTWEWNVQTGDTVFNEKWANIIGYTLQEISPVSIDTWVKYAHPDDLIESNTLLEKHFKGELDYYHFESRMKHKNGDWVWVLDRGKVVSWTADGKPLWMFGTHQEITNRKYIEEALKESQQRFKLAMKATKDGLFDWNLITNEIYFSPSWKSMLGYEYDELPNDFSVWKKLTEPDGVRRAMEMLQAVIDKTRDRFEVEFKMKHKDGHWVDILSRAFVLFDEKDKAYRMVGTHVDISEIRQITNALKESESRLFQIIEGNSIATFVIDENHKVTHWNNACENLTGLKSEQIVGTRRPWKAFYQKKRDVLANVVISKDPEKRLETYYKDKYKKSSLIQNAYEAEGFFPQMGKSGKWLFFTAVPLQRPDGTLFGAVETLQDITERKNLEEELRSLVQNLEIKNAEMERFIYTVSHDLKSPMITIEGFLGIIRQEINKGNMEKILELMTFISNATHQMEDLLNDLLELSRIGRVVNVSTSLAMNEIVADALLLLSGATRENNIEIDVQSDMPQVVVDRVRIKEVIVNLIENSIKYRSKTEQPKIKIGCQSKNDSNIFFVQDNGIGVDSQYHEKIFGLFDQLDPKVEGTGVGLALVRRIIEFHGGRIWVESKGVHQGSTFYFTLNESDEQ